MIWLPGVLSQGGKQFVWARYALKNAVVEETRGSNSVETGSTTAYTKGYVFHEDTGLFDLDSSSYVGGQTDDYVGEGVGAVVYSIYEGSKSFKAYQLTSHSAIYKKTISRINPHSGSSWIYFAVAKLKAETVRGEYIDTVEAAEGTYPDNGIQGGYWYVLQTA